MMLDIIIWINHLNCLKVVLFKCFWNYLWNLVWLCYWGWFYIFT